MALVWIAAWPCLFVSPLSGCFPSMFTQRQSYCEGRTRENRQNCSHANQPNWQTWLIWCSSSGSPGGKHFYDTSNNQNYNEWQTNAHLQINVCLQDYSLKNLTANVFSSEKHEEKKTGQYNTFQSPLYFILKIGKLICFNDQCQWVWYSVTIVNLKRLKITAEINILIKAEIKYKYTINLKMYFKKLKCK